MPNKPWKELNIIDQQLRTATPPGMDSGVQVSIHKIFGFELFNTRPYHNYETWSDGYRVEGEGITIEAEDLDEAVALWISRVKKKRVSNLI